ncbi:MAG TPA: LLM class flavin-dependent oxidoreductase [Solirubrobacterales bacterium]|jgi:FMN-dependent oxidoreductase (nitrilotriacetate monooxygenase family)|nr:LLM class flavin-dependent oxidoreductase [Solirubrobacterales bacterium]
MDVNGQTQMHINLFLAGVGHHEAAWRRPGSRHESQVDFEHYRHAAAVAEAARLDSVFLADTLATGADVSRNVLTMLEPISLLAALAGTTSRIGLIATASTSYQDPFNLARRFAGLDHLTGGRVGWNIVTSVDDNEARNFGREGGAEHAGRYARAAEFVEVTNALWDSWEDDALLADKSTGVFADTERIHAIDHEGEHFGVSGPLGVPRSPQGRPVLVQAGSSESGRDFAAGVAEAIFTAQQTLADGQEFYLDLKGRASAAGRDPGSLKILPGISPMIGSTEEEARRLEDELAGYVQSSYALAQLSFFLETEIGEDQLDQKLPELAGVDSVNRHKSRYDLIVNLARSEDLTVRQLIGRLAGGRGHRTMVGTPEQVADDLESWFVNRAADGFNYMPPTIPDQLEVFVDQVVPILQRRGLFRTEYEGTTLRDHYGLERPASQFAGTAIGALA